MASNPIKRRARQSFLLGFLIALVVMAVVVMVLFTKINSLNEENKQLKVLGPRISVYTVKRDIEVGDLIKLEDLDSANMQLAADSGSIEVNNYIDPTIFSSYDEEKQEEIEHTYTAKVKIPAGTVVTLAMLQEGGVANDERLMEYSCIVLPSQLINGDYIDIRMRLANGTETVIFAKKKVEQCTDTTIWMKMTEKEILTMNSAIVDAYLAEGSQIRATVYTNPLMQEPLEENYPVNDEIRYAITFNPNIVVEARQALVDKWRVTSDQLVGKTDLQVARSEIDSYIKDNTQEQRAEKVEAAYEEEAANMSSARSEYVSALEGTGLVGATTGY